MIEKDVLSTGMPRNLFRVWRGWGCMGLSRWTRRSGGRVGIRTLWGGSKDLIQEKNEDGLR